VGLDCGEQIRGGEPECLTHGVEAVDPGSGLSCDPPVDCHVRMFNLIREPAAGLVLSAQFSAKFCGELLPEGARSVGHDRYLGIAIMEQQDTKRNAGEKFTLRDQTVT
jgi:hypothetical protein